MVNKKNWMGILVMVLVFGCVFMGCDELPEEEKIGAETINGVWYGVNGAYIGGSWEKTGTVITVSNGVGILTSVGNDLYSNYVNQGLINIGDPVFKNVVYIESRDNFIIYSYDVWAVWNTSTNELPAWHNGCKLKIHTKGGKDGKTFNLMLTASHENVSFYNCVK